MKIMIEICVMIKTLKTAVYPASLIQDVLNSITYLNPYNHGVLFIGHS